MTTQQKYQIGFRAAGIVFILVGLFTIFRPQIQKFTKSQYVVAEVTVWDYVVGLVALLVGLFLLIGKVTVTASS